MSYTIRDIHKIVTEENSLIVQRISAWVHISFTSQLYGKNPDLIIYCHIIKDILKVISTFSYNENKTLNIEKLITRIKKISSIDYEQHDVESILMNFGAKKVN